MNKYHSHFFNRSKTLPFIEMRQSQRASNCYHLHSHDEFSFGVVDAGAADYINLRQKKVVHTGTTVTINPGDAHSCNPKRGHWSYRMLFVDSGWIGKLQKEMLAEQGQDYLTFPELYYHSAGYYQAFDVLFKYLLDEYDALVCESQLIEFLAACFVRSNLISHKMSCAGSQEVSRVKELIMDRLDHNLSLDEFSQHSGLSRYHLIRSFKKIYGQPPHAFQLDQRIIKAKSMLQKGMSLASTASALGFSDQSHFQRNFKKRLAVTPKQYQAFFV